MNIQVQAPWSKACGLVRDQINFDVRHWTLAQNEHAEFHFNLLVAFLAVFCESAFDGFRNLLGAQIDLLPALVVYAALSAGLPTVTLVAVLGGLFFDSLSANPLGITVMPLFVVGFLINMQRELILRDQLFAQTVLGLERERVRAGGDAAVVVDGRPRADPELGFRCGNGS